MEPIIAICIFSSKVRVDLEVLLKPLSPTLFCLTVEWMRLYVVAVRTLLAPFHKTFASLGRNKKAGHKFCFLDKRSKGVKTIFPQRTNELHNVSCCCLPVVAKKFLIRVQELHRRKILSSNTNDDAKKDPKLNFKARKCGRADEMPADLVRGELHWHGKGRCSYDGLFSRIHI